MGGAYRPPTLSALMRHILHLPADKDVMFRRKDFVPLFDVRCATKICKYLLFVASTICDKDKLMDLIHMECSIRDPAVCVSTAHFRGQCSSAVPLFAAANLSLMWVWFNAFVDN